MAKMAKVAQPLCLTAVLSVPLMCAGASFKVASLDLSFSGQIANEEMETRSSRLARAATDLRAVRPDVILLQGVRDWRMCNDLAQMLKPADYQVIVCSSFRDLYVAAPAPAQAAILARHKGYFSWSGAWKGSEDALLPGGYAFAALTIGGQKVGCFSTLTEAPVPREFKSMTDPDLVHAGSVRQILAQLSEVQRWVLNRPGVFMVGGSLDPELSKPSPTDSGSFPLLTGAGFTPAPVHAQARPACFFYAPGEAITIRTVAAGEDLLAYEVVVDGAKLASGGAGKGEGRNVKSVAAPAESGRGQAQAKPSSPPQKAAEEETVEQASRPETQDPSAAKIRRSEIAPSVPEARPQKEAELALGSFPPPTASSSPAQEWMQWQLPFSPWLAVGAGFGGAMLVLIPVLLWLRRRKRSRRRLLVARTEGGGLLANMNYVVISAEDQPGAAEPRTVVALEPDHGPPTHMWQQNVISERLAGEAGARTLLVQDLRRWMKEKLFQKLFRDRKSLLESQEEATIRAAHVTERLARIENQIQEQNRMYQLRIDELTRELNAAREESRELLRARIAQVKAEMESARARLLASAERGQGD